MPDDASTFADYKKLMNATFQRHDQEINNLRTQLNELSIDLAELRTQLDMHSREPSPPAPLYPSGTLPAPAPPPPVANSHAPSDRTKIVLAVLSLLGLIVTTLLTLLFKS